MTRNKTALAVRHVAFEDLGVYGTALQECGFNLEYCEAAHLPPEAEAAQILRRSEQADLLIILGGPVSAVESQQYPFLQTEQRMIAARLQTGKALLGICLGAQLIAQALGARVYANHTREIGIAPITLSQGGQSSCLRSFATAPLALHWHGDTFDLPAGANLLASSALTPHQAFESGSTGAVLALQFHAEVPPENFEPWLIGHAAELNAAKIAPQILRAQMQQHSTELARKGQDLMRAWLRQVGLG